jgi:hypothetical protein
MIHVKKAFHDLMLQRHFGLFLRRSLKTLNPEQRYLPNWHIRAIEYQLERIRRGEITRLIINMPPRHLKSLTVSVAFPAFLLGHEPWHRIFAISYSSDLSSKHASDFRSIVESAWYRRAFPKMRISRSALPIKLLRQGANGAKSQVLRKDHPNCFGLGRDHRDLLIDRGIAERHRAADP